MFRRHQHIGRATAESRQVRRKLFEDRDGLYIDLVAHRGALPAVEIFLGGSGLANEKGHVFIARHCKAVERLHGFFEDRRKPRLFLVAPCLAKRMELSLNATTTILERLSESAQPAGESAQFFWIDDSLSHDTP